MVNLVVMDEWKEMVYMIKIQGSGTPWDLMEREKSQE